MRRYRFKRKRNIILISLIDFIGNIFFKPFIKKPLPQEFKNILIIRLDHIGDVLLTTPAIRALRSKFSESNISILVGSWAKDIVEENPNIDEIILYDAPWFNRRKKSIIKDIIDFFNIINTLRRKSFDLSIEFRGDIRNILLAYFIKIPYRIGYDIGGGGFLLSRIVPYLNNKHEVEKGLDIVQSINIEAKDKNLELYVNEKERNFAKEFFCKYNINEQDLVIGIHPGAGNPSKLWQEDKFAKLGDEIIIRYNAKIIISGANHEKDLVNRIQNLMKRKPILIHETTIKQLSALIERYTLLISVDSAPMHIAVGVNTPVISLFSGINDPSQWGPYGKGHIVVQKDVECKGCELKECKNHKCMNLITVDEVLDAVKIILEDETHMSLRLTKNDENQERGFSNECGMRIFRTRNELNAES